MARTRTINYAQAASGSSDYATRASRNAMRARSAYAPTLHEVAQEKHRTAARLATKAGDTERAAHHRSMAQAHKEAALGHPHPALQRGAKGGQFYKSSTGKKVYVK